MNKHDDAKYIPREYHYSEDLKGFEFVLGNGITWGITEKMLEDLKQIKKLETAKLVSTP